MYVHRIDVARKAVAIAMAVCGVGLVVCVWRDDYLSGTLRLEPGIWRWGASAFGIGVYACLVAAFAFVVEYLARPGAQIPFALRPFLVRALVIVATVLGTGIAATLAVGPGQGVGVSIGTTLALAAWREHGIARVFLAAIAITAFCLALWSAQSHEHRVEKGVKQTASSVELIACSR
jgi:hypothetical protein